MSGFRPIEMDYFYRRLHARGLDTKTLAAMVGRNHASVSRVLNGSRRRGALWEKIKRHLQPEEIALLDVAHSSPWNKRRLEKRPKWTPEKAMELGAVP